MFVVGTTEEFLEFLIHTVRGVQVGLAKKNECNIGLLNLRLDYLVPLGARVNTVVYPKLYVLLLESFEVANEGLRREIVHIEMTETDKCFVVMPFGEKPRNDGTGRTYNFEKVYRVIIKRAIEAIRIDMQTMKNDDLGEVGRLQYTNLRRTLEYFSRYWRDTKSIARISQLINSAHVQ